MLFSIIAPRVVTALLLSFIVSPLGLMAQQLEKGNTVVFLGDSITREGALENGYISLASQAIEKEYPEKEITLIGAGIGGHKVSNCLKRLQKDVLDKEPDVVVIFIGINDVWHWTHPQVVARGGKGTERGDFEKGLQSMIQQIEAKKARVILCTPTVIGEKHDGSNELDQMLDDYSEISRKVAKQSEVQLLDLRKLFLDYLKKHNSENREKGVLTRDAVHLNAKGNEFLAGLMLEALGVSKL